MNFLRGTSRLIHDISSHVRDQLLPERPAESESAGGSSPASQRQHTDSEPSGTDTTPRPNTGPMSSDNVRVKRNLETVLAGTGQFDPILVEDDDSHGHKSPSSVQNKTPSSLSLRSATSDPKVFRTRKVGQSRPSAEEKRLLGLYAERIPDDAVLIKVPSNEMSYQSRSPYFTVGGRPSSGPLRPVDTLSTSNPPRTRSNFISVKTNDKRDQGYEGPKTPSTSRSRPQTSNSGHRLPLGEVRRVSSPPKKKRKLSNSTEQDDLFDPMLDGKKYTDSSDHSHPQNPRHNVSVGSDIGQSFSRRRAVRRTPLRDLAPDTSIQDRHQKEPPPEDSPDELLDEPAKFTMNAKKHREEESNSISASRQKNMATGSETNASNHLNSSSQNRKTSKSRASTISDSRTPPKSKIERRIEGESPDVLHNDRDTSDKRSRAPISPMSPIEGGKGRVHRFDLQVFVSTGFLADENAVLEVDEGNKSFRLNYKSQHLSRDALLSDIPLSKILRILWPEKEGLEVIGLHLSATNVLLDNSCYLEFTSRRSLADFIELAFHLDPTIKIISKDNSWIDSAMGKAYALARHTTVLAGERARNQILQKSKPKVNGISNDEPAHSKRSRKIDQLDHPPSRTDEKTDIVVSDHFAPTSKSDYGRNYLPRVTKPLTRSSRQTQTHTDQQEDYEDVVYSVPNSIERRRQGSAWRKPLIYPPNGRRLATVAWDDLERLEDGEMLNDSLVTLFLRYLQENADQDQVKTMHFFSTFFYEVLMRRSEEKGSKGQINYNGVANWTKNIFLFRRDFVIVPVHELNHWYAMVVCNLQSLKSRSSPSVEENDDVVDITGLDGEPTIPGEFPKIILESDVVVPNNTEAMNTSEVEETENPGKKRTGRRRSIHRGRRKYDLDKPVIITLDSLDISRSATASALKDYLVQEAREKSQLEIEKGNILGMTAKSIPLQGNYYDCGLYLCAYLEQFMHDPHNFVKSILQRDADALRWPARLQSKKLRQRLYELLQELHLAQEQKRDAKLPEVGKILIRDEDFLAPERKSRVEKTFSEEQQNVKAGLRFVDAYYSQDRGQNNRSVQAEDNKEPSPPIEELPGHDDEAAAGGFTSADQYLQQAQGLIVIDDDSQPQAPDQDGPKSRYFHQNHASQRSHSPKQIHDTPMELVDLMRRNSKQHQSLSTEEPSTNPSIDLVTPIEDQPQHQRRTSVSTDFLTGDDSYDIQADSKDVDQIEKNAFYDFNNESDTGIHRQPRDGSVIPESDYGDSRNDAETMIID